MRMISGLKFHSVETNLMTHCYISVLKKVLFLRMVFGKIYLIHEGSESWNLYDYYVNISSVCVHAVQVVHINT